jgi:hypothetical protein
MKKNNNYLLTDEINLATVIKTFWKEKILILSLGILGCLSFYLYAFFQPQVFKAEVTIKNPPTYIFDSYIYTELFSTPSLDLQGGIFYDQYLNILQLNLLSLENFNSFLEQNTEFDNFKVFLKSINITAKQYFANGKFGEVKEKNKSVPNKYFIIFGKELDGIKFINNYVDFSKKNSVIEIKKNLKNSIDVNIEIQEQALDIAKLIGLEKSLLQTVPSYVPFPQNDKFYLPYKGAQTISKDIFNLKKLSLKLENEQFTYNYTLDKASSHIEISRYSISYYLAGLFFGLSLSFIIIFFKSALKNT